jgi:hypothetical protein
MTEGRPAKHAKIAKVNTNINLSLDFVCFAYLASRYRPRAVALEFYSVCFG